MCVLSKKEFSGKPLQFTEMTNTNFTGYKQPFTDVSVRFAGSYGAESQFFHAVRRVATSCLQVYKRLQLLRRACFPENRLWLEKKNI